MDGDTTKPGESRSGCARVVLSCLMPSISQPSPPPAGASPVPRHLRLVQGRLLEKRQLAAATWHLRWEVPSTFQYDSGQFVLLNHEVGGKAFHLPYSIACPAQPGVIELCVRCMEEGPLTGFPCGLELGTVAGFEGPFGLFVPRHPERDALFVAQGTGIGPIRSILQDLLRRASAAQMTLLVGARDEESILYREEWAELQRSEPRFHFLPTLSQPSAQWAGLRGYVQQHLPTFIRQRELAVYMCGSPQMVEEVRSQFTAAGFDGHQLIYERYGD